MSDKGEKKKSALASLRKAVKPEVECKAFFVGKWNAGHEISDDLLQTVSASITPNGGIRTKLRIFHNGLRVGEKGSIFSAFPEQFYPIASIRSLTRDEKNTNTIIVVTLTVATVAQIYEISVYRCPTEYEARQFVESFEKNKVGKTDLQSVKQQSEVENWSMKKNSVKKYPRAMIAASTNGMNGHDEGVKVTTDHATKTMVIQAPEPIYATVNKQRKQQQATTTNATELTERVRALELENLRLREFINQHLVTTYQAMPFKQTEVPVNQMLLLEGNRLKRVGDEYMTTRSETASLANSGQFERGSLQYQRQAESVNGYTSQANRDVSTRFMVPAETLRRNLRHHTYVQRKIGDVYKAPVMREPVQVQHQPEYEGVAESLPPRDSMSSLSDMEDADANGDGELFEITTPTPVRYM